MSEILEALMVIGFGISWPLNILKSIRSRTAKGKSLLFLCFILAGYICGILSKILAHRVNYVLVFYVINSLMVILDLGLFFRNKKIDKSRL